jgi:hypothetical protein
MFPMHNLGAQSFRLTMAMLAVGISTSPAHAYLDPGTGSIILQVLLGGVAGIVLASKLYWHKLLSLCGAGVQAQEDRRRSGERSVEADERRRQ